MIQQKPIAGQLRKRAPASVPATYWWFTQRPWILAALLVLVTFVAYQPAWNAGFIWDDDLYVSHNGSLRSVEGLWGIWSQPSSSQQYYPLVFMSFWVEYQLWGAQSAPYHRVNIFLHALNALLLWQVLRRLEVPGALLAAAIFALHPVEVETAAWITERKNLLSAAFYFLAMLAYFRFRPLRREAAGDSWNWCFYPLVMVWFLGAMFSKTVACSLPAVLLLLTWWKRGRLDKRDVLASVPLFIVGAALGLTTAWLEKHHARAGADWSLTFLQRCLLAGRSLWFYAGKLVWPHPLIFIYPRWNIDLTVWWQYLFSLTALVALFALWRWRNRIGRGPLVAALAFTGILFPALGFVDVYPFRFSFVADHFQYLASAVLISLFASGVAMIWERMDSRGRSIGAVVIAIMLVTLGALTWNQAHVYQSLETLWRDTVTKNPQCWMAHNNLGTVLLREAKVSEATAHYEAALRLKPDYAEAHFNLALVLADAGRLPQAASQFEDGLRVEPDNANAQKDVGGVLMQLGRNKEAVEHWEKALQLRPDYPEVQNDLAWVFATSAELGNPARAVTLAERACQLTKNRMPTYLDTLAAAYAAVGRFTDAVGAEQKAIDLVRAAGEEKLVADMMTRLELYRSGRAYRVSDATSPTS